MCSQRVLGHRIGKNLLARSIEWADQTGVEKMVLNVLASNKKAIELYQKSGFEIEGILKKDRRHADGQYYDTIVMGRFKDE